MADRRLCPDGGTCHHECGERYAGACWRVWNAAPLAGVFAGDRWPEEVRDREHAKVVAALSSSFRVERGPDTECRDGDTRLATTAALKSVKRAVELAGRGHATLAADELAVALSELEAQAVGWEAVEKMLGAEPHVCSCDHTPGVVDGCSSGFEDRCRFEAALRKMAGLDG